MVDTLPDPTASNLKVSYGTCDFCYLPSRMLVTTGAADIVKTAESVVKCSKCL